MSLEEELEGKTGVAPKWDVRVSRATGLPFVDRSGRYQGRMNLCQEFPEIIISATNNIISMGSSTLTQT